MATSFKIVSNITVTVSYNFRRASLATVTFIRTTINSLVCAVTLPPILKLMDLVWVCVHDAMNDATTDITVVVTLT